MNVLSLADFDWLQGEQLRHDSLAHADIMRLPMPRQLVHWTLCLAKYQGSLLKALQSHDGEAVQRLITDSFITLLAIANALGRSLRNTGASRPFSLSRLRTSEEVMSAYVEVVGEMSKACEAFDGNENFPSHTVLDASVTTLIRVVIDLANLSEIALVETIPHRWNQVERNALADGKATQIADVA
jgi:hypothetical protein